MGIRIHTAIGWAIPYEKLKQFSPLYDKTNENQEDLYEIIDNILSCISSLNIPEDDMKNLKAKTGQFIFAEDLLDIKQGPNKIPATYWKANNLVKMIYEEPDGITHVIFYPNLSYAEKCYRYDDELDYALFVDEFDEGKTVEHIKYVNRNHYPYHSYMDENGNCLDDEQRHIRKYKTKEPVIPAVPAEIRWWTQKIGILTEEGVNQLRPIIAHWWS